MATKNTGTLNDMEGEVTCPLCLDIFKDPRVLSCQHNYCKSCLEKLISQSRGPQTIFCPECRKPTDSTAELPVAFKINRLIQIFTKMQLEVKDKAHGVTEAINRKEVVAKTPDQTCSQHPGQALDVYCCECEHIVCRECILFGIHSNHPYNKLEVTAAEKRETLSQKMHQLLKQKTTITNLAAGANEASCTIERTRDVLCTKVSESYDRAIHAIEQKKQSKLKKLCDIASEQLEELKGREANFTVAFYEISSLQRRVEQGFQNLGDAEFISQKDDWLLSIDEINSRIVELPQYQPVAELSAKVMGMESAERLLSFCDDLLKPYVMVDQSQSIAIVNDDPFKVGNVFHVTVLLKDSEGAACPLSQSVTVELCCTKFGNKVNATVNEQSSSRYNARLTPTVHTRGRCCVVVTVNGQVIENKPAKIFIECPPHMLGELVYMFENIPHPGCVRIVNDRMLCNTRCGLCFLDLDNKLLSPSGIAPKGRKFKKWNTCEMALNDDKMYLFISDGENHKVHKFKINGEYVRSTLDRDTIKRPNGLCVAPNRNLYVCDSDNHCIQVFNQDLNFCLTFGSLGTTPGKFYWPDNIGFDSSGDFYVTELLNHRIQCFTSAHFPKWCIGTEQIGPQFLYRPNVMQVVGANIFIADHNSVVVFNTQGQFITRFGGMCTAADGITIDQDGFVYVSDIHKNRIGIF